MDGTEITNEQATAAPVEGRGVVAGEPLQVMTEDGDWQDASLADLDPLSPWNPDFGGNLAEHARGELVRQLADELAPLVQPPTPPAAAEPEWTAEDQAHAARAIGLELDRLEQEIGPFDRETAEQLAERILSDHEEPPTREQAVDALRQAAESARNQRHARDLFEQLAALEQRRYHDAIDPKRLHELATEKLRRDLETGDGGPAAALRAVAAAAAELGGQARQMPPHELAQLAGDRARILEAQARGSRPKPAFKAEQHEIAIEHDGQPILTAAGQPILTAAGLARKYTSRR